MKTRPKLKIIALLPLLTWIISANAQDWPQFLGPERNSTSPQENLLRSWPDEGPEVLWRVDVGIGYGGAVTTDDRV